VVEDAHESPLAGVEGIRFYAELPMRAPSSRCIGALQLMDRAPRPFPDEHRELVRVLWQLAEQRLEVQRC